MELLDQVFYRLHVNNISHSFIQVNTYFNETHEFTNFKNKTAVTVVGKVK